MPSSAEVRLKVAELPGFNPWAGDDQEAGESTMPTTCGRCATTSPHWRRCSNRTPCPRAPSLRPPRHTGVEWRGLQGHSL